MKEQAMRIIPRLLIVVVAFVVIGLVGAPGATAQPAKPMSMSRRLGDEAATLRGAGPSRKRVLDGAATGYGEFMVERGLEGGSARVSGCSWEWGGPVVGHG